jgi:hypothetical protein
MSKTNDKLRKLNRKANKIYDDDSLDWEQKYDKIFSDKISMKVFKLVSLSYYDPDTSYQEDVCAFMSAFNDKIEKI